MKIMFVFWDMARVNLTSLGSDEEEDTIIDSYIRQFGGEFYSNAFTPAPDTPRSLACFQSGILPIYNGCDTRIKWPKYYLKDDLVTIHDLFEKNNYNQLFYIKKQTLDTGAFVQRTIDSNYHTEDFEEFKSRVRKELKTSNDLMVHLHLQDYHWAIDDYGANDLGVKKAQEKVVCISEEFFKEVPKEEFDYVIFFSDHGHKFDHEIYSQDKLLLLNNDRSQILLHIYRKNDNDLTINDNLHSILDIYHAVDAILDGSGELALVPTEHIIVEDHTTFNADPTLSITQWRYLSQEQDLYTDIYRVMHNGELDVKVKNIMEAHGTNYRELKKRINILKYYKRLSEGSEYSNCTPRLNQTRKKAVKLVNRSLRVLYKFKALIERKAKSESSKLFGWVR